MIRVAVYNLFQRELEDEKKINEVTRAVLGAILSIPGIGLKEEDISFTFPQDFMEGSGIVSVVISVKIKVDFKKNVYPVNFEEILWGPKK